MSGERPDFDPYAALGVAPGATPDEIASAYRRKAAEYHPDRVQELGPLQQYIAAEELKKINAAYDSLRGFHGQEKEPRPEAEKQARRATPVPRQSTSRQRLVLYLLLAPGILLGLCFAGIFSLTFVMGALHAFHRHITSHAPAAYYQGCDSEGSRLYNLGNTPNNNGDERTAAPYFKASCDRGCGPACTNIGWYMEMGLGGFAVDYTGSFPFNKKGCLAGNANGCGNLALLYTAGIGAPRNRDAAEAYYALTCKLAGYANCEQLKMLDMPLGPPGLTTEQMRIQKLSCLGGFSCVSDDEMRRLSDQHTLTDDDRIRLNDAAKASVESCASGVQSACNATPTISDLTPDQKATVTAHDGSRE